MKFILAITGIFFFSNVYAAPDRECTQYAENWEIVDSYTQEDFPGSTRLIYPLSLHTDETQSGKIYVTGADLSYGANSAKKAHVRYSRNFGRSWESSSLDYDSQYGSLGIRITEAPNGNVIVFQESSVFSSRNFGKDFDLISDMSPFTNMLDLTSFLITDSVNIDDRMYITAVAKAKVASLNNQRRWHAYILYSDDNGTNWNYFDEYFVNEEKETWFTSIATDSYGNIYTSGHWQDAQGEYQAMAVAYTDQGIQRMDFLNKGIRGNTANRLVAKDNGELFIAVVGREPNRVQTAYLVRADVATQSYVVEFEKWNASCFDVTKGLGDTMFYTYTDGAHPYTSISTDGGNTWDFQWGGSLAINGSYNYAYETAQDGHANVYTISQAGRNNWLVWKRACLRR